MRALLLFTLFSLTAFGAPLEPYRHNFFTTNPSPVVEVVAGTNTSVQYSTAGTHTRRYTVNSLQSPWTGDIDGGNHSLTNVDDIASDGGTFSASVLEAGSRVQTPELYIPDSMMLDYGGIRATNHFELNSQTGDAWFGGTISGDGSGLTNLSASAISGVLTQGHSAAVTLSNALTVTGAVNGSGGIFVTNPLASGSYITNTGYGFGVGVSPEQYYSLSTASFYSDNQVKAKNYLVAGGFCYLSSATPGIVYMGPFNNSMTRLHFSGGLARTNCVALYHESGTPPALSVVNGTNGPANLSVSGTLTATNGMVMNQLAVVPTNSVPASSLNTITNFLFINLTNIGPCYIYTNNVDGGLKMLRPTLTEVTIP